MSLTPPPASASPCQRIVVAFLQSAKYERQNLLQNPWDFSLIFWLPLGVILLVWWVFSHSQIIDLPIGVVDYDQGQIAQTLIQSLDASPDLQVASRQPSSIEAKDALTERQIYGIVTIPANFSNNILSGKPAPVVLQVNAQFGTHSGIIQKGVQSVVGTVSATTEIKRLIARGTASSQVIANYSPITIQRVSLFNAATDYQLFLASTVLPALLHILAMIVGASTIGRELRDFNIDTWYHNLSKTTGDISTHLSATGTVIYRSMTPPSLSGSDLLLLMAGLIGKLIWPMLFFSLWSAVALTLAYQLHPVDLLSWGLTYLCLLLLMMVSFWLGAIITLATFSLRIGLSAAGFISAPSFAFAGVTFPYIAINDSAKYWTDILPLTHYLKLHIAQLQMSAPWSLTLPIVYGFMLTTVVMLLLTGLLTHRALRRPDRWGAR